MDQGRGWIREGGCAFPQFIRVQDGDAFLWIFGEEASQQGQDPLPAFLWAPQGTGWDWSGFACPDAPDPRVSSAHEDSGALQSPEPHGLCPHREWTTPEPQKVVQLLEETIGR